MEKINFLSDSYLLKISKVSLIIFIINLFLFGFVLFTDNFFDSNYAGDESKYLSDLLKANQFGLGKAISDGASITYVLISFYVNKIIHAPLYSLKITSIISGILMFLSLYFFISKYLKLTGLLKQHLIFWLIYLFVIQTTFFSGVNDILLDLFGTLFFITFFIRFKNQTLKILLTGLLLALALVTRKMALTYIFIFFVVFIVLSLITRKHRIFNFKNGVITLSSLFFFFLLFNLYPLIKNSTLSFDDKSLKGNVNWAQWDYHNALLIDQGLQGRFTHVSIAETRKYLKKNGEDSLPSSFLEMIYFNPLLTFKEFFVDLAIGIKYILRQTGLLFIPFSIFLLHRIRKIFDLRSSNYTDFIYLFSACYLLFISFIVIANVQSRWFMFFLPIMMVLLVKDMEQLKLKNKLLFYIGNNIILSVMCFPFLFDKISLMLK